jgi:proteasome lid subunit RPN8/RPN11
MNEIARTSADGQSLRMEASLLREILQYGARRLPHESGGLLLGRVMGNTHLATAFHGLENTLWSPARFLAGAAQTVRVVVRAAGRGEQVVATVHTHPDAGTLPSARDMSEAFGYASCLHMIVSYAGSAPHAAVYQYEMPGSGRTGFQACKLAVAENS